MKKIIPSLARINDLYTWLIILAGSLLLVSCKKQDNFLATIPDASLAVPATLNDLQLMVQHEGLFNENDPGFGTVSADEYYITDASFIGSTKLEQNLYIWAKGIYPNETDQVYDWSSAYSQIYTANVILESLAAIKVSGSQLNQYNTIKGSALFFRAKAFFNLLQVFSLPYDSAKASLQLGIPLRLNANLNIQSVRASQQDCYIQLLQDLQTAAALLPVSVLHPSLPSSVAANGFLARVYLSMGSYSKALQYANACLAGNASLTDYNTLKTGAFPIAQSVIKEDIFHSVTANYGIIGYSKAIIDTTLYNSYQQNDLRKSIFFYYYRGNQTWNGTYDVVHTNIVFDGIATDEIYLTRAECFARQGNVSAAMNDLNTLLINRYKTGTFIPYTATSADDALNQVLTERKKELLFRGTRWTDLRRLNKEPRFAQTIRRKVQGTTYELAPNDPKYALPLPPQEIQLSGVQQNQR